MAKGDKKLKRTRGGGSYNWDAASRLESRAARERVLGSGNPVKFLEDLGDNEFFQVYESTHRMLNRGIYDWQRILGAIDDAGAAQRIEERVERVRVDQDAGRKERQDAYVAKREKYREEKTSKILDDAELTAGLLRSDFADVFRWREVYGQRDGDWLDDPVAAYATGYGFGEEVRERSGIKLQVTVSIDLSNSMKYNGINEVAVDAFCTIYLSMKSLQQEHPGDLYIAPFEFSGGETGRHAMQVKANTWRDKDEYDLGEMELWRNASRVSFDGEDTWMYPLLVAIERWENENSDPGAVRLDIVITDAVLEHPKDIRESSKIQERRDGNLQTVLLNLMPEEDWLDTTLPLKCVQYPANPDNLAGLLRNVLAQFVSVYV